MTRHVGVLSLLALTACPDQGLTISNTAPEVVFIAPTEGTRFASGTDVLLQARVSDPQNSLDELTLLWSTDRVTRLVGAEGVNDDVATLLVAGGDLPPGEHQVVLTVLDPFDASGSDSVGILVEDNAAPTATFVSPQPGEVLRGGEPVAVQVRVADDDEPRIVDLVAEWTGPGTDALPVEPTGAGLLTGSVSIDQVGEQTLSVRVFDTLGGSSEASVTFTLFDPALDRDEDGYQDADAGGDDCNDDDAGVNPGAVETCDGVDQDCNGLVDDDPTDGQLWWVDSDRDGYGASGETVRACSQPDEGTASNDRDCDDTDPLVNPGRPEIPYNGVDDDCMGGDACDVDGDLSLAEQCGGPDCDDSRASVRPGQPEIPYNGLDDDCIGGDSCDLDGDGVSAAAGQCGGTDCDDDDPTRFSTGPIEVPTQAPTIQAAVDALCEDGRVDVLAGTYPETVDLGERDIDVVGVGSDVVTVNGVAQGPVFTMTRGRLEGMTLTQGSAVDGGGVRIVGGVGVELVDLVVHDNTATHAGGGIAILDAGGTTTIDNVRIDTNTTTGTTTGSDGGGLYIDNSRVVATDLVLHGNSTRGEGGGLHMAPTALPFIGTRITASANEALERGGVSLRDATLTDLVVTGNTATSALGAGVIRDSEVFGLMASDNETTGSFQSTLQLIDTDARDITYTRNTGGQRGLVLEGNDTVATHVTAVDNLHDRTVALVRGAELTDAVIANNDGLGIDMGTGGGTDQLVSHVTVAYNTGHGVLIGAQSNLALIDSIIAYNDGTGIARNPTSTAQPSHVLLWGNGTAANFAVSDPQRIDANPQFTDTSGAMATEWDLSVQSGSPAEGSASDGLDRGALTP